MKKDYFLYGKINFFISFISTLFCLQTFHYPQSSTILFDRIPYYSAGYIYQDSKGFLWFVSNERGLARYDGYEFKYYSPVPFDSTSISNVWAYTICEDLQGYLWIGTAGGGLNRFDRKTEKFIYYKHSTNNENSISGNHVTTICVDDDNSLWLGTDRGMSHLIWDKNSKAKFVNYRYNPKDSNSLSDNYINKIYKDKLGDLWIGTMNGGLNQFNKKTGKFTRYVYNPNNLYSISHNTVSSICEDKYGNLWIGTGAWMTVTGGGLNMLDRESGRFIHYKHDPKNLNSLSDNRICTMIIDSEEKLWIGTGNGGLNLISIKDLYIQNTKDEYQPNFLIYRKDSENERSIRSNSIICLLEDNNRNIWIGNKAWEVNKYDRNKESFEYFLHKKNDSNSLSENSVWSVYEDSQGKLWIGTFENGLDSYDPVSKKFTNYRNEPNDPNSLGSNCVWTIYEDSRANLWVGTRGGGLNLFDRNLKRFIKFLNDPEDSLSIGSNNVLMIVEDKKGFLWLSTILGGLNRFDPERREFIKYKSDPFDLNSISSDMLTSLIIDKYGILWIGTFESGLNRFDPTIGRFTHYRYDVTDTNTLSSNFVLNIYESQFEENIIWIGTPVGLNKFNTKTESFNHFLKEDGLPSNYISNIREDRQGNLWLGIDVGLCRFNPSTKSSMTFTKADGLISNINRAAQFSSFLTREGKMYVSSFGVYSFFPDDLVKNEFIPPVVLTEFEVLNQSYQLDTAISEINTIHLSYDQNMFSFKFAALNFTNAEKNQYAYKLEGFYDDWIYIGNERVASFTDIEPGEYIFRVKGSNNHGIWNETGASVVLIITPPWWATLWFRTLMIVTIFALGYSIYRYRLNKVRQMERLRVQIASDLHDDIGSTLTKIAVHSEIIHTTTEKEKVSTSSQKIGTMSREIITTLSDVVWSIDSRNDTVGDLIDRMRDFLETVFPAGSIHIDFQTKGLHFDQKITQALRQNIYLIFKEAVNNAAKHSGADEVKISMINGDGKFKMEIADNGAGIKVDERHGRHHGIENMEMRAKRIGGKLTINKLDKGTSVLLIAKNI